MSDNPVSMAGRGNEKSSDEKRDSARRPIFVSGPPAHAGIVAALRTAFAPGPRSPDNDVEDEFSALLERLN